MRLPDGMDDMIEKIAQVNDKTCVVIQSGTQTEMPWFDRLPVVLQVRVSCV